MMGVGTLPRGELWAEGSGLEIHSAPDFAAVHYSLGTCLGWDSQSLPSTLHPVNHRQGGLGATGHTNVPSYSTESSHSDDLHKSCYLELNALEN